MRDLVLALAKEHVHPVVKDFADKLQAGLNLLLHEY